MFSMALAMFCMTSMQRMGCWPMVVSAESMMASAFSVTALATSETSARVGSGDWIMDSSMWVAMITGFAFLIQRLTALR